MTKLAQNKRNLHDAAVGRIMTPKNVHVLILESMNMLCGKKDLVDVIKVMSLETGRLSWNIQVGPICLHEYLQAENIPCL